MKRDLAELIRIPGFTSVISARFISNLGNGLSPIALAYGVLSLPGSNGRDLSLVMVARFLPMVMFMLFGGVIGDRFKRNRIVGGADIIGSFFAGTSALSFIFGFASVPLLCLMGALFGILNALWWPAMSGVLPEVLPKEMLQRGNALVSLASNFGFVFGALIGGTVVTLYGSGWALFVDAVSFLLAGILVWNIDLPSLRNGAKNSMLHDLRVGWKEFISRSWVVAVVLGFTFINFCFEATIAVLGPLSFKGTGHGPRDWSFNLAVWTIGMIVGGVISIKVHFKRPLAIGMIVIALSSTWNFSIALGLALPLVLITAFITGVAFEIFTVVWTTAMQKNIPEESYSRVVSYDALGSFALAPIGIAIAGPIAEIIGTSPTLYFCGAITLLGALIPLAVKSVRQLTYPK
ncbi:MAG: MFS transporter [Actinobacteria bacterium]|nr:MFS transporter [Actinomycetota bacterium]